MSFNNKIVTVFGGTGFIGRQIVRELAALGAQVKIATRVPESGFFLKPCGNVGQIASVACNYADDTSINAAIKGSDFVINCIGILFEKKRGQFDRIHGALSGTIAKACRDLGVERLVHISALGIEGAASRYAASKREGEVAVRSNFPSATILRPSVVFGPDDNFFNMFARMAELLPVLPLIGGGHTKFQPVYVGDVADAVLKALSLPDAPGETYALGGPQVMDFRQVYEILFHETGRRRILVTLPWRLAKVKAMLLNLLPKPFLTPDQVEQLKTDSIVPPESPGFADLGIMPTSLDLILPRYLHRYKPGGRFGKSERA